ncbi:MAG: hypothetical protein JW866_09745 [Ignavibacteriales bacterium]|nr:hypothetical protein [Ignavibacteriales bacterium]
MIENTTSENGFSAIFFTKYLQIGLIIPSVYLLWLIYVTFGIRYIEKKRHNKTYIIFHLIIWLMLFFIWILMPIIDPIKSYDDLTDNDTFFNYSVPILLLVFVILVSYRLVYLENKDGTKIFDLFRTTICFIFYPFCFWNIQNRIRKLIIEE